MRYGLGVDLGTTSVAAAISYGGDGAQTVLLGDRSHVVPAVVYAREDGSLATGEAAARRGRRSPERFGHAISRRLGNPTPVILGGTPYSVPELLAALLRDVMHRVIRAQNGPPENVFLTRPASWDDRRRALFEQVAGAAGLSGAFTVTDAEAAATHYAASHRADGETVAVYDLGGGTFQATALRIRPSGPEILGPPQGTDRLGGIDFDDAILSYVNFRTRGALSTLDTHSPQTAVTLARLRQDCVAAREALSVDDEVTLPVFLPGRDLSVRLTRAGLEDMVRMPVASTVEALTRALRFARVAPHELSAVLIAGGASRMPIVGRMVSDALGPTRLARLQPEQAVALGAAMLAARFLGDDRTRPPGAAPLPPARSGSSATPRRASPKPADGPRTRPSPRPRQQDGQAVPRREPTPAGAWPPIAPLPSAPPQPPLPPPSPLRSVQPFPPLPSPLVPPPLLPEGPLSGGGVAPQHAATPTAAGEPPATPQAADPHPTDEHRAEESEWQAPPFGRTLMIGVVMVALAVVVGLIVYVVISRV